LAAAAAIPAISATRTPPFSGTENACEVSVSPSTVVVACTEVPAASPSNCARPCSSVVALREAEPTLSVTAWPAMLLPIRSRTTRTVTVRSGSSGAGSGVPAIADGSGMLTWAYAGTAIKKTISQLRQP